MQSIGTDNTTFSSNGNRNLVSGVGSVGSRGRGSRTTRPIGIPAAPPGGPTSINNKENEDLKSKMCAPLTPATPSPASITMDCDYDTPSQDEQLIKQAEDAEKEVAIQESDTIVSSLVSAEKEKTASDLTQPNDYPDDHVGITDYGVFSNCYPLEQTGPRQCIGVRLQLKDRNAFAGDDSVTGKMVLGQFRVSCEGNWQKIDGQTTNFSMQVFQNLPAALEKLKMVMPKMMEEETKRQQRIRSKQLEQLQFLQQQQFPTTYLGTAPGNQPGGGPIRSGNRRGSANSNSRSTTATSNRGNTNRK